MDALQCATDISSHYAGRSKPIVTHILRIKVYLIKCRSCLFLSAQWPSDRGRGATGRSAPSGAQSAWWGRLGPDSPGQASAPEAAPPVSPHSAQTQTGSKIRSRRRNVETDETPSAKLRCRDPKPQGRWWDKKTDVPTQATRSPVNIHETKISKPVLPDDKWSNVSCFTRSWSNW